MSHTGWSNEKFPLGLFWVLQISHMNKFIFVARSINVFYKCIFFFFGTIDWKKIFFLKKSKKIRDHKTFLRICEKYVSSKSKLTCSCGKSAVPKIMKGESFR